MPPILLSTVNQCTFIKDRNNNLRRKNHAHLPPPFSYLLYFLEKFLHNFTIKRSLRLDDGHLFSIYE